MAFLVDLWKLDTAHGAITFGAGCTDRSPLQSSSRQQVNSRSARGSSPVYRRSVVPIIGHHCAGAKRGRAIPKSCQRRFFPGDSKSRKSAGTSFLLCFALQQGEARREKKETVEAEKSIIVATGTEKTSRKGTLEERFGVGGGRLVDQVWCSRVFRSHGRRMVWRWRRHKLDARRLAALPYMYI